MRKQVMAMLTLALAAPATAQQWTQPIRGSWVRVTEPQPGDVTLVTPSAACDIVVAPGERSNVRVAARFLASDIERITGRKPRIVARAAPGKQAIVLQTLGNGDAPGGIRSDALNGKWEAYQIRTAPGRVHLVGSNPRGTAFAAYTLSERLGIDPLYLWTGYQPGRRTTLVMKATDAFYDQPTFKYRGLFHDDEDILPRPFDPRNGYPYVRGTVPTVWYERFFETALRLRMNQVAPFVRVNRPPEIARLASDWGLYFSSHHYDILLSNPYGFSHFELAKKRGVDGSYDYFTNRDGIMKYFRAGVEEHKDVDAIYPVGLRGTDDTPYRFPEGTTLEQKSKVFEDAIRDQIRMAREVLGPDREALFHLTLYNEMLETYRRGNFDLPEDVLLIWDDNGDGIMRGLPDDLGRWKHGVYYHLAFFGVTAKQSVHTVTPMRVAGEFRKIVDSGATEYMLLNVSELREHVMETRMIAEICWDAKTALAGPDPAARYVDWWSREYFGASAAPLAAEAYRRYYAINDEQHKIWYASVRVRDSLTQMMRKMNGESFQNLPAADVRTLNERLSAHEEAQEIIRAAMEKMTPEQGQFFFEHASLGLLFDYRPTQAALRLQKALESPNLSQARSLAASALPPLSTLEAEIRRAERPPFEGWYRPTWIRVADYFNGWSDMNPHRPYAMLRQWLEGHPLGKTQAGEVGRSD